MKFRNFDMIELILLGSDSMIFKKSLWFFWKSKLDVDVCKRLKTIIYIIRRKRKKTNKMSDINIQSTWKTPDANILACVCVPYGAVYNV